MTQNNIVKIWWLASRPKTLWASICPVMLGCALAFRDGKFYLLAAIMTLLAAVLIQIGTNLANDYYDFINGADNDQRIGPQRVTQSGLVKPSTIKKAFIIVFCCSAVVGSYLIFRGGIAIAWIGFFSILFGVLYTGGPYPLGYHGWGDILVLIFFGPVAVAGTYYLQALNISLAVVLVGLSPGLFSVAILTANNLRDVQTDKKSGKRTLAVRFGESFAKIEYVSALVLAILIPLYFLFSWGDVRAYYQLVVCAILLILSAKLARNVVKRGSGQYLNITLGQTAKLLLIHTTLLCIGCML